MYYAKHNNKADLELALSDMGTGQFNLYQISTPSLSIILTNLYFAEREKASIYKNAHI